MGHLLPTALDEAAHWFVLLASGEATPQDRERWQAWRTADPAHESAWQRATAATARFAAIPPGQAKASLAALDVRGKSSGRRRALGQILGVFAVAAAGWQSWRYSDRSADALTGIGEQREIVLADGSRMLLDTNTAVDTEFSGEIRLVRLRRGRIMIATAPAPAGAYRPFFVTTAEGRVQALGTRFIMEQEPSATRVAVLESRVALQAARATGPAPILQEGEAARFDRYGRVDHLRAKPAEAAWTRGMLVTDDMDLRAVIAELARYRPEPMACDAAVAGLRISGTFPLADADRALAALAGTLPIRVERRTDGDGKTRLVVGPR